jgi:SAM-dependent methyltransferase
MTGSRSALAALALAIFALAGAPAGAQQPGSVEPAAQEPYTPRIGQAGKDVVWVPTPPALLDLMLDLAQVTTDDFVMDLGSGDGRNIIAAARRGARGVGVEYNPDMVALSSRLAQEAGVADKATFVEGDMYQADISKANVMAVFLLPANMEKLLPSFKTLAPGSRIVSNTFGFEEWDPDVRATVKDGACADWCEALLWIVPAPAAGEWAMEDGTLKLTQLHQVLYGTLSGVSRDTPISKARMRGYDITYTAGYRAYPGRLRGNVIDGTVTDAAGSHPWTARRMSR